MALTKASTTILASQAVGAAATVTGTGINLTAGYGGEIVWKITNGVSAPTTAPTIELQSSDDNTNWYRKQYISGDITASSVNSGVWPVSTGVMYVRAIFIGGATNGSTMACMMEQITSY